MQLENAKDIQNQCFILLVDLHTMGNIRQGKFLVWVAMEPAAIFSSSFV